MITASLLDTALEIKVTGRNFSADLKELARLNQAEDRVYVDFRKVWVVTNWQKYADLPFVKAAVEARRLQLPLFGENNAEKSQN